MLVDGEYELNQDQNEVTLEMETILEAEREMISYQSNKVPLPSEEKQSKKIIT